jgi:hypothetical protein
MLNWIKIVFLQFVLIFIFTNGVCCSLKVETAGQAINFFENFVNKNVPLLIPDLWNEMVPEADLTSTGLSGSGLAAISVESLNGKSVTTLRSFFQHPTNSYQVPVNRNLKTRIIFPAILRCDPLLPDLLWDTLHSYAHSEDHGSTTKVGLLC